MCVCWGGGVRRDRMLCENGFFVILILMYVFIVLVPF